MLIYILNELVKNIPKPFIKIKDKSTKIKVKNTDNKDWNETKMSDIFYFI